MLHKIFAPGPWFAPKRFGFGAGRPTAWQGWTLLASYMGIVGGAGLLLRQAGNGPRGAAIALLVFATVLFIAIAHRRTDGGWRWRWGGRG